MSIQTILSSISQCKDDIAASMTSRGMSVPSLFSGYPSEIFKFGSENRFFRCRRGGQSDGTWQGEEIVSVDEKSTGGLFEIRFGGKTDLVFDPSSVYSYPVLGHVYSMNAKYEIDDPAVRAGFFGTGVVAIESFIIPALHDFSYAIDITWDPLQSYPVSSTYHPERIYEHFRSYIPRGVTNVILSMTGKSYEPESPGGAWIDVQRIFSDMITIDPVTGNITKYPATHTTGGSLSLPNGGEMSYLTA